MAEQTKKPANAAANISTAGGFLAGSLAACGAVTFTNPIELIKTRMQLQGELSKSDKKMPKLYKNPAQAFVVIFKNEGIRGLQQGLTCAYLNQIALNGCRLGLYEPSRYYFTKFLDSSNFDEKSGPKNQKMYINVCAGTFTGVVGAVMANPFFLIKTRMQSYSSAAATSKLAGINIGQQTFYNSTWHGLKSIYKLEGFKGLFRGVSAAMVRTGSGASVQLPVYNLTKQYLLDNKLVKDGSLSLHFFASSMAGLAVAIFMNPGDVILTRVYNQKGDLYKGMVDCFVKTVSAEGVMSLYKGFWAQLLRIGPHLILTLMFMEHSMKFVGSIEKKLIFN